MAGANTDNFLKVYQNFSTTIGAGGVTSGTATTIPLTSTTNLPTDTAIAITINRVDSSGNATNNAETVIGVVSGTNLTNCVRAVEGTGQAWGSGIVVELLWVASAWNRAVSAILSEHNQDGTHAVISGPQQSTTPTSPASGKDKLYFKTDDRLYKLSSAGTEKQVVSQTFPSSFANFVQSGLTIPTSASLSSTSVAGTIYYNGVEISVASDGGHTYTASNDCYVDVSNAGAYTYNTVANGAAAPALTASSIRIAKVVTNGSAVTAVTQSGVDGNNVPIYPANPGLGITVTGTPSSGKVLQALTATVAQWASAGLLTTTQYAPQGFLINGKIVPSVATNNLTVAIKGMDGNDPSASNPVYIRIGDTVRTLTAALSKTLNAGTNWFNAGSAELATNEIDYFVYMGYNATDGITLGFSRLPGANSYGDFSVTTTNEKYAAISTITNAVSTDYYELIGRFPATLSAGAGYTWTVPAFTAINLIQHPVYETRGLTWTPTLSASGAMTLSVTTQTYHTYRVFKKTVYVGLALTTTTGGTASNSIFATLPFTAASGYPDYGWLGSGMVGDGSTSVAFLQWNATARNQMSIQKYNGSNYALIALSVYGTQGNYDI